MLWLFVAAFLLRTAGLSHDLHHGTIYHPDTPKQMRAVEQFLGGDHLVLRDHPDYDGYPYFNSHLIALGVRGIMAVQTAWQRHVGAWTQPVAPPTIHQLYWITRTWNALLSALAVCLLFVIGRRFGKAVAWAAAGLLLISPLDITGCHYASNDTTAAFFALAALWFGLRIAEEGRWLDLAGGALCVGAAFSTKYHAAMSVLPVVLGLWLYTLRTDGGFRSRATLLRWPVLLALGLAAAAITSPALLIHPSRAFKDILGFFAHTADFGLPAAFRALPAHERLLLGWRINIPLLVGVVGLPVAVAGVLAWLGIRREPRLWLVLSVPLVHVALGLAGKPNLHLVHHLPALPYIFLATAVLVWGRTVWTPRPALRYAAGTLFMLWSLLLLAPMAHREAFFFRHTNTQRLTANWARDTVPDGADWRLGRYTFHPVTQRQPDVPFQLIAESGSQVAEPPHAQRWFTLSLEDRPLTLFRNRDLHIFVGHTAAFQPPVTLPWVAPLPAGRGDSLLPLDLPWLGRTPLARDVHPARPVDATAMTTQPLDRVWVAVHTGSAPARLQLDFGGRRTRLQLGAGQRFLWEVEAPRRTGPRTTGRNFYRWRVDADWGQARVSLFTDPAQAGLWALQWGDHETAGRLLQHEADRHPLYAAALGQATSTIDPAERQRLAEPLRAALESPEAWNRLLGLSADWLDRLPYVAWETADWTTAPQVAAARIVAEEDTGVWYSPSLELLPGQYRLEAESDGPLRWSLLDICGRVWQEGVLDDRAGLHIPAQARTWQLRVDRPPGRFTLRPDTRATLAAWIEALENPPPAPEAGAALGDPVPVARFANGLVLREVHFIATRVTAGADWEYRFDWQLPDRLRRPRSIAVWVHVEDETGRTVAQGDHALWVALSRAHADSTLPPCSHVIRLPESAAPGVYTVRAGLWVPAHRRRVDVAEATVEHGRRHLVLGTITVEAD